MPLWRRLPAHPLWIVLTGCLVAGSTLGAGWMMDDVPGRDAAPLGLVGAALGRGPMGRRRTSSPMVISLGLGIVFGTAITLVIVPCLYLAIEDVKRP